MFSEAGLAQVVGSGTPGKNLAAIGAGLPGVVGVTLGEQGFLWLKGGCERHVPAFPVATVDTLAAGDVWHGVLALTLGEGLGIESAARFANAAAAIKCSASSGVRVRRTAPKSKRRLYRDRAPVAPREQSGSAGEWPGLGPASWCERSHLVGSRHRCGCFEQFRFRKTVCRRAPHAPRRTPNRRRSAARASGRFVPSFANN
jgi:hypothetical protein